MVYLVMSYLLCRNRVTDFATWKRVFDSHAGGHRDAGLRLLHLWRGLEEPENVFFLFEVLDMEKARGFIDGPSSAEAAEESGVLEGEFHFVESTDAY